MATKIHVQPTIHTISKEDAYRNYSLNHGLKISGTNLTQKRIDQIAALYVLKVTEQELYKEKRNDTAERQQFQVDFVAKEYHKRYLMAIKIAQGIDPSSPIALPIIEEAARQAKLDPHTCSDESVNRLLNQMRKTVIACEKVLDLALRTWSMTIEPLAEKKITQVIFMDQQGKAYSKLD